MRNNRNASAGFTLLETIAAMALAGLVIAILGEVFIQSTHTQRQLIGRTTALVLGSGKLTEVIGKAESNTWGDFPAPYSNYHWSYQKESLAGGYEKLELVVEWGEKGGKLRRKILRFDRLAE